MKNTIQNISGKNITGALKCIFMSIVAIFFFTQCGNFNGNFNDGKTRELKPDSIAGIRIVYADIDSIILKYNFAIDTNKDLIKRQELIKEMLRRKSNEINRYRSRRVDANTFQEYKEITNIIIGKEEELVKYKTTEMDEFNKLAHAKDKEVRDSIANFITQYNSRKGYDYILAKYNENMLYANKSLDITNEIVDELNSRYTPKKEKEEEK